MFASSIHQSFKSISEKARKVTSGALQDTSVLELVKVYRSHWKEVPEEVCQPNDAQEHAAFQPALSWSKFTSRFERSSAQRLVEQVVFEIGSALIACCAHVPLQHHTCICISMHICTFSHFRCIAYIVSSDAHLHIHSQSFIALHIACPHEVPPPPATLAAMALVDVDIVSQECSLSSVIASMKSNISTTVSSSAPAGPSVVLAARPAASVSSSSGGPPGIVQWTDLEADPPVMNRSINGEEEAGILEQGTAADGMAIVTWPNGSVETTEVPNLLVVSMKRPAIAVRKRPAKILRPAASLGYHPVLARPDIALEHSVLYYKNTHIIGIRQKVRIGGRQLFSFGGKHCEATEQELRDVGIEVCKKLADGWSIDGGS